VPKRLKIAVYDFCQSFSKRGRSSAARLQVILYDLLWPKTGFSLFNVFFIKR
jgi:hypothetical protein